MNKVFVYGTLRRGEVRSYVLGTSKYICPGVVRGYQLYFYAPGGYPFVVENSGVQVVGEMYEVSDVVMNELDRIEGVSPENTGLFIKRIVPVTTSLYASDMLAFMYIGGMLLQRISEWCSLIVSGDFKER